MITYELDNGRPVIIGASKKELIRHLRKQGDVFFDETKLRVRPDGRWQYLAVKAKDKG